MRTSISKSISRCALIGPKALSLSQVYRIIASVRAGGDTTSQKGKATTKIARTRSVITSVEALITSDRRLTVEMSEELDILHSTIHWILTDDLRLSKKVTRWVPKLLDEDMKKKRIEASEVFVNRAGGSPEVFLSEDYNNGRDYDELLHSGDERTVQTVALEGVSGSNEVEESSVKQEADGFCVLR